MRHIRIFGIKETKRLLTNGKVLTSFNWRYDFHWRATWGEIKKEKQTKQNTTTTPLESEIVDFYSMSSTAICSGALVDLLPQRIVQRQCEPYSDTNYDGACRIESLAKECRENSEWKQLKE